MSDTAIGLAIELLGGRPGSLKELRIHEFTDDESAHEDDLMERLYAGFSAEFDRVEKELTEEYGLPLRAGREDDKLIPLNGVFRFAVWKVGDRKLFAVASHEDRGAPILLMLGTA